MGPGSPGTTNPIPTSILTILTQCERSQIWQVFTGHHMGNSNWTDYNPAFCDLLTTAYKSLKTSMTSAFIHYTFINHTHQVLNMNQFDEELARVRTGDPASETVGKGPNDAVDMPVPHLAEGWPRLPANTTHLHLMGRQLYMIDIAKMTQTNCGKRTTRAIRLLAHIA